MGPMSRNLYAAKTRVQFQFDPVYEWEDVLEAERESEREMLKAEREREREMLEENENGTK